MTESDYNKKLLKWHIATEFCYYTDDENIADKKYCECSKLISDYLIYLLVKKPKMITRIPWGSRNTSLTEIFLPWWGFLQTSLQSYPCFCRTITVTYCFFTFWQTGGSRSVLSNACQLAEMLKELGNVKWEMICSVLMEMLCYAACHCKATIHYQQLSEGG